jgi:hypothetical protein
MFVFLVDTSGNKAPAFVGAIDCDKIDELERQWPVGAYAGVIAGSGPAGERHMA